MGVGVGARRSGEKLWPWPWLLLLLFASTARARRLPDIFWNSTNPIFRVDNTDHVMSVEIRDRLSFVCPYKDPDSLYSQQDLEYSQIYRVSRREYEACALSGRAELVGTCKRPLEASKIKLVFRQFTPVPGGLEYHPGRSYYFISTSNGSLSGMGQRRGGLCKTHNVRLKIEVEPSEKRGTENGGGVRKNFGRPVAESPRLVTEATPSPTPLMYIIHTRPPSSADAELRRPRGGSKSSQTEIVSSNEEEKYEAEEDEDDGGGAATIRLSSLLVLLPSLLLVPPNLLPLLLPR